MSNYGWSLYIANNRLEATDVKNVILNRFGDHFASPRGGSFKHDQGLGSDMAALDEACAFETNEGWWVTRATSGYQEWFGFSPNLRVHGRLTEQLSGPKFSYTTREESEEAGLLFVARIMFYLLDHIEGDAVIRAEDVFIFLRKAGKVTVDFQHEYGRWTPELINLLPPNYQLGSLAV